MSNIFSFKKEKMTSVQADCNPWDREKKKVEEVCEEEEVKEEKETGFFDSVKDTVSDNGWVIGLLGFAILLVIGYLVIRRIYSLSEDDEKQCVMNGGKVVNTLFGTKCEYDEEEDEEKKDHERKDKCDDHKKGHYPKNESSYDEDYEDETYEQSNYGSHFLSSNYTEVYE